MWLSCYGNQTMSNETVLRGLPKTSQYLCIRQADKRSDVTRESMHSSHCLILSFVYSIIISTGGNARSPQPHHTGRWGAEKRGVVRDRAHSRHKACSLRHQAQESPYNRSTAKIVKIKRYWERFDPEMWDYSLPPSRVCKGEQAQTVTLVSVCVLEQGC